LNGIVIEIDVVQAGLASVFIEAPDVMQQKMQVPQQFLDQCKNMNRKTSGNAAGFDDLVTFTGINPPPKLYPDYIQAKGYFALAATVICALLGLWAVIWYASFDFPQK
jgi:iron transport multicopper oxidase